MHEYSLVSALLSQVEATAAANGATEVHRVRLQIGDAAGVERELFKTAFDMVRQGTICAGAELEIVAVPVRWACGSCERDIAVGAVLRCPDCGAPARMVSGDEIILERLELEVADV